MDHRPCRPCRGAGLPQMTSASTAQGAPLIAVRRPLDPRHAKLTENFLSLEVTKVI